METTQLARRLKELREKDLRLKTQELADALAEIGVDASNASVSRYERGLRIPPADYLWGISELTGVSVDYLLFEHAPRTRAHANATDPYANGVRDATDRMAALLVELREAVGAGEGGAFPLAPPLPPRPFEPGEGEGGERAG